MDKIYSFIKEVYLSGNGTYDNVSLKLLFGDARSSLTALTNIKFHAVFQDPFSPSKNPELWTVDYFRKIKELMDERGIVTTYSSADHIRRAMMEAGFILSQGPSVGKKREGTIASLKVLKSVLSKERIDEIMKNIKSEPYRDPEFNFSREEILRNRLEKIKKFKIYKNECSK